MPKLKNSKERCFDCGVQAVHAHHVVPRSLGGSKTVNLCAECHGKVHNRKFIDSSALVKKGLKKLNEQGYYHGRAPYGFNYAAGEKVPNQQEQKVISQILKLHDEGENNAEICRRLNQKALFKRDGKPWTRACIWGLLHKSPGYRPRKPK
jgi:hypothetical protein